MALAERTSARVGERKRDRLIESTAVVYYPIRVYYPIYSCILSYSCILYSCRPICDPPWENVP